MQGKNPIIFVSFAVLILLTFGYIFYAKSNMLIGQNGQDTQNGTPSSNISTTPKQTNFSVCTLVSNAKLPIYLRPSSESSIFAFVEAGDPVEITSETIDGQWFGFDPGVPQAANVGPFRLRYLEANNLGYEVGGPCDNLPKVPLLSPDACYLMAESDTPIYERGNKTSKLITTLHSGDYIPITEKKAGISVKYWLHAVADTTSSVPEGTSGWIPDTSANFNGSSCESLPIVK